MNEKKNLIKSLVVRDSSADEFYNLLCGKSDDNELACFARIVIDRIIKNKKKYDTYYLPFCDKYIEIRIDRDGIPTVECVHRLIRIMETTYVSYIVGRAEDIIKYECAKVSEDNIDIEED